MIGLLPANVLDVPRQACSRERFDERGQLRVACESAGCQRLERGVAAATELDPAVERL